jgi:tRNA (cytidine/uridine-2'-O-)-methyltransferase
VLEIVLYQPEIPQNTGTIARTCAVLGARLHLIRPYGFILSARAMQRSAMDYFEHVELLEHVSWAAFEANLPANARVFALSSQGSSVYTDTAFQRDDYLVFGRESDGLPSSILEQYPSLRIPMPGAGRSLNLAVSVGIVAFEAARQITQGWSG